jgi:phosphatidylserine/phosphatidylglycerophosphate/cardiolipin synthase-like enzyme
MDFLEPGQTCWRIDQATRVAFLVDVQDYFVAVGAALQRARRSIHLLGWGFDPRTRLQPDGFEGPHDPDEIGDVLIRLAESRPELDVRLLIWKSALPIAASQEFFPHKARAWFKNTRVKFRLDDAVPLGACHHQKVLVIDDELAFCSGGDFGIDRWDTTAHLDEDARRIDPNQDYHPPRHEVTAMVEGPAARALGDLVRARWLHATGETVEPPAETGEPAGGVWPEFVHPALTDMPVALARTAPAWHGEPAVTEWRDLTLRSIAMAERTLYMENQYFTSPVIAEALARRLTDPRGPEIVLVSTEHSPSYFDKLSMDRARSVAVRRLREADVFGRLRLLSPHTPHGKPVIVHAKVTIVDDRLLRIGSANLNNRSGGLDTEVELGFEAGAGASGEARARTITTLRNHLVGHYFGRSAADIAIAIERHGGLIGAIDRLNTHGRLTEIAPLKLGRLAKFVAAYHLGDPTGVEDAWRPIHRRKLLDERVRAIAQAPAPALELGISKSITSGK